MRPAINVRDATEADLENILQIEQQSPTAAHWSLSTYREMLLANPYAQLRRALRVADRPSQIVGFAVARALAIHDQPTECELENIAVTPLARGVGVATALLFSVCDWARQQGADQLNAEVRENNKAALALYEKAGFKPTLLRKNYYRSPDEDAQVLTLHL